MELCLIAPAAHVEWTSLLPGRFCLANVKHDGYREFFIEAAQNGYEVVLDNGAFEGELVDDEEYIEVIQEIKPQVVVVPDLLNANSDANLQHAHAFVANKLNALREIHLMFVPQCERDDSRGYRETIVAAIESERFQWIGICRNACFNAFGCFTHTEDEAMNKFFFGAWAERHGILELARKKGIRFHLLGIGGNLSMLQHFWWADRADTASLFFHATLGETVSVDGILADYISRPSDYFRRDFGNPAEWVTNLKCNCIAAQVYASEAARLKHKILKDRI